MVHHLLRRFWTLLLLLLLYRHTRCLRRLRLVLFWKLFRVQLLILRRKSVLSLLWLRCRALFLLLLHQGLFLVLLLVLVC